MTPTVPLSGLPMRSVRVSLYFTNVGTTVLEFVAIICDATATVVDDVV